MHAPNRNPSAPHRANPPPASHRGMGPFEPFACVLRNRNLVFELGKREVLARYRASRFGLAWTVLNPLLLLGVFAFVFGGVMRTKWNRPAGDPNEYALVLFAGLVVFWLFNDCLMRAPGLIRAHRQYVTRVVFPLEVLPWIVVIGALFHLILSFGVLLAAQLWLTGALPWTAAMAPLLLIPFVLFILGLGWAVAALAVYLPDVEQMIGVALTATLFVSTIFFPAEAAPAEFASLLYLNPISWVVDAFRGAVLWGELPRVDVFAIGTAIGWASAWLGFLIFQKSRRGFADVL